MSTNKDATVLETLGLSTTEAASQATEHPTTTKEYAISKGMNIVEEFIRKTEEAHRMPPVNIMMIGKTGVGKSTLINAVFRSELARTGVGKPVTKHLRKITKEGVPLTIYDTRGLELDKASQDETRTEILSEIRRCAAKGSEKDFIHVVWYCIHAASNRVEECEVRWIEEMAQIVPVILVITQSIGNETAKFIASIKAMNLPVTGVIPVLATPYEVGNGMMVMPKGLDELVDLTRSILPECVERAFVNSQRVSIDMKVRDAKRWVRRYVVGAFGVGFTPLPFSDAAALVPMQLTMFAHISAIFGVQLEEALLEQILLSLGGIGGATIFGRLAVSNLIKLIPGVGTIAGGLISGTAAASLTTALGMGYTNAMRIICEAEYRGKITRSVEIARRVKSELENAIKGC